MDVDKNQGGDTRDQPDIDSAETADWPRRDFPIRGRGTRNYVQVVIRRSVLEQIHEHGQTTTDVEICGVLIGDCYQDDRGPFVYVEHIIRGENSDSKAAQVTFTAETWNHIQNELDRDFPEKRILGWYHTHPGFGIFLSEMDMFIHRNFFSADQQLAFVYDPVERSQGLFIWRSGKARRDSFLVEEDAATTTSHDDEAAGDSEFTEATAGAETTDRDLSKRLKRLERRLSITITALIIVTILALSWPLIIDHLRASGLIPDVNHTTTDDDE